MTKPTVLFVCVHNAGRSQMAAALLDRAERGVSAAIGLLLPAERLECAGQDVGRSGSCLPPRTLLCGVPD